MNKRLIVLFSCLALVVLLVVVACVSFTIMNVTIETTNGFELTDEEKSQIISDSKIIKYSSIFSLDEDIAIQNIESQNPTLKVVVIERKFPNNVSINISKREPIASIAISTGEYALVDRELKVVQIVSEVNQEYITKIDGVVLDSIQCGAFVDYDWLSLIISSAEDLSFVNARFSTFFTNITYTTVLDSDNFVNLKTNTGVTFVLTDDAGVGEFLNYAYTYYVTLPDLNKNSGYIVLDSDTFNWVSSI